MPVIQVEAELSVDELLKAVQQLSQPELERFVPQVIALRAQHVAPIVSAAEAELLAKINQGLAPQSQERWDELVARRRAEALSQVEYEELLELSQVVEDLQARRIGYLTELARLRKTTLRELMDSLGIQHPGYA